MKKINILLTILIIICNSCGEEFLETSAYDSKVIGTFYKTPKDALEALAAAYDPIRWDYSNHIVLISEIASDNCFGAARYTDDDRLQVWDNFDGTLYPDPHSEPYEKNYTGIYRVNILLENLDNVDWGDEPNLRSRYESEAKFLRAYYYFDLVRLWGNISLVKEVIDVENLNIEQADPKDVYAFIAEDLKFAIENLSAIPYSSMPADEGGRVTKWAAEALMGRVFLYYTGYYKQTDLAGIVTKTDVQGYIDDVILNSEHDLVPNYAHLWKQAGDDFVGEDNIETVFAIKYTHLGLGDFDKHYGNNWQVMISPIDQIYGSYANGWGGASVNPALYHEWDPEDSIRRNATIIGWVEEGIDYDYSQIKEYTGYNWKKFVPLAIDGVHTTVDLGANYMIDNPDDKPEIRYSDVLLMGAELFLDSDPGKALGYFNRVRDRAYIDDQHREASLTFQTIMDERRWEFALEGLRYWDLLRQGLDVAKATIDWNSSSPYYNEVIYRYDGNVERIKDIDFRVETGGLFSIPLSEINLSEGVVLQNPGWDE
ncbi:RagB/SusD family nutrient uptake outer membrane protein [Bacteroidota bacterium]